MCKSKMIGHGATQCYLVKVYEGLTKGDEEQKKGLNIERGLRKCHEVKEPNEDIRDNTSLGEYLKRAIDTFVEREEF